MGGDRCGAGGLGEDDIVNCSGWIGACGAIVAPHENKLVGVGYRDADLHGISLPSVGPVEAIGRVKGNPAGWHSIGVGTSGSGATRQLAGNDVGRARRQKDAQVVVVGLTIGPPVVGNVVGTHGQVECAIGIDDALATAIVSIGRGIGAGNKQGTASGATGVGANIPAVGLGTVGKNPTDRVGLIIKRARIADVLRLDNNG